MKQVGIISFLLVLALQCKTQDLTLSQYFNLPSLINPAAAGYFPEQYRVSLAYKNQWSSVTEPFVSSLFSIEATPVSKKKNSNFPSFGLIALADKAGNSGYKANMFKGMGAYHFKLGRYKSLSFGLEASYNQRSFSLDGLAWDSQYDGAGYDPSLPTNENYMNSNVGYIDFGMGAEFRHENPRNLGWKTGIGIHHYYQEQTALEGGEDKLPLLAQAYWQGQQTNGFFMYRYYALLQSQNSLGAVSGTVGGDISYRFNNDSKFTNFSSSSALTAGVFYRYRDAVVALVGYEHKRIARISISYDITISSLSRSSRFQSGPELNLVYLGNFGKKKRKLK